MCNCPSCEATDSAEAWPDLDENRLARYIAAKDRGKVPTDPVYAAHVRHTMTWKPNYRGAIREFTDDELRGRSMRLYSAPKAKPVKLEIPEWEDSGSMQRYIDAFDKLNRLVSVDYQQPIPLQQAA